MGESNKSKIGGDLEKIFINSSNTNEIILTIAIPLYNGSEFLTETIDSIVKQDRFEEIELVFCDDISSDNSCEIVELYIQKYSNIKLFRNKKNLGMDKNFDQVVKHATGEFFWFSGQDDIFRPGAVNKILDVITKNQVDFVFVNYSQCNHDLSEVISQKVLPLNKDVVCHTPQQFFNNSNNIFPGFLPAYVLKKSLWDSVDKTPYYGTIFVQEGVFLELLPNMVTYIVAEPFIQGRIPDNRWQKDNLALLDVFSGHLEIVFHHYQKDKFCISNALYKKECKRSLPVIYRRIVYLNIKKVALTEKLKKRFKRILKGHQLLIIYFVYFFPTLLLKPIVKLYFGIKK